MEKRKIKVTNLTNQPNQQMSPSIMPTEITPLVKGSISSSDSQSDPITNYSKSFIQAAQPALDYTSQAEQSPNTTTTPASITPVKPVNYAAGQGTSINDYLPPESKNYVPESVSKQNPNLIVSNKQGIDNAVAMKTAQKITQASQFAGSKAQQQSQMANQAKQENQARLMNWLSLQPKDIFKDEAFIKQLEDITGLPARHVEMAVDAYKQQQDNNDPPWLKVLKNVAGAVFGSIEKAATNIGAAETPGSLEASLNPFFAAGQELKRQRDEESKSKTLAQEGNIKSDLLSQEYGYKDVIEKNKSYAEILKERESNQAKHDLEILKQQNEMNQIDRREFLRRSTEILLHNLDNASRERAAQVSKDYERTTGLPAGSILQYKSKLMETMLGATPEEINNRLAEDIANAKEQSESMKKTTGAGTISKTTTNKPINSDPLGIR